MTLDLKYEYLFNDHMEIARQRFIEKNKREPNLGEQLSEYKKLMEYFYD